MTVRRMRSLWLGGTSLSVLHYGEIYFRLVRMWHEALEAQRMGAGSAG